MSHRDWSLSLREWETRETSCFHQKCKYLEAAEVLQREENFLGFFLLTFLLKNQLLSFSAFSRCFQAIDVEDEAQRPREAFRFLCFSSTLLLHAAKKWRRGMKFLNGFRYFSK